MDSIKSARNKAAEDAFDENSELRLSQKRIVKEAQFSQLKRTL